MLALGPLLYRKLNSQAVIKSAAGAASPAPQKRINLMKLDLAHSSKENLELIHNLLEEASEA